jgi:hypothetical protein
MTTKTKATADLSALDSIFGTKPKDAIFLPSQPYQVRFNCKSGQLAISEDDFLGKEAEISVLKVSRWFGDLGKTRGAEWLQLFYVPAPGCDILPSNTVCISYVKTRSLSQFQQVITRLLSEGQNPATGVFKVSFVHHVNGERDYYSVKWEWRDRDGEAEAQQLEQIVGFMQGGPILADPRAASGMVCIDGLTQEEIATLMEAAREERKALEAAK